MSTAVTVKLSKSDIKTLVKESVREVLEEELEDLRDLFASPRKLQLGDKMDLDEELRLWDKASEEDFSKFVKEMKF